MNLLKINKAAEMSSAGFGSITSAGDPRIIQFGLKFNFYDWMKSIVRGDWALKRIRNRQLDVKIISEKNIAYLFASNHSCISPAFFQS